MNSNNNLSSLLPELPQLPLLIDTQHLSAITSFAEQTIRHWANKTRPAPPGWPEPVFVGRNVRYRTSDVIKWIEGGCQPRATEVKKLELQPIALKKRGRGRPKMTTLG